MTTLRIARPLALLVLALLLAGCRGGPLDEFADTDSLARLHALPGDAALMLSLHGPGLSEGFPGTKPLGSLGDSRLLVAPRSFEATLDDIAHLERVVVWGDDRAVGRLDPLVRLDLLMHLDASQGRDDPEDELSAIATFAGDASALRADLGTLGLSVGSATGGVATLTGPTSALLDLLARPDLIRLEKPELQIPTPNRQRIEP